MGPVIATLRSVHVPSGDYPHYARRVRLKNNYQEASRPRSPESRIVSAPGLADQWLFREDLFRFIGLDAVPQRLRRVALHLPARRSRQSVNVIP